MKKADIYVVLAGAFWGLTGFAFQILAQGGFTRMGAVAIRLGTAALGMLVVCLVRTGRLPKVKLKDLPYCVGAGVFGFAMFNLSYFATISISSLSVAAAFLYTSPAFVILLSRLFYKEPITKTKLAAMAAILVGSVLITGAFTQAGSISLQGVGMGLLTGFGYALYNLLSKAPLSRNSPEAVTFYTLLSGAAVTWALEPPLKFIPLLNTPFLVLAALGMGLLCCMLPSLLFSKGLSLSTPGRASILVASELVVASVIGFLQGDALGPAQVSGLALLLLAIWAINRPAQPPAPAKTPTV